MHRCRSSHPKLLIIAAAVILWPAVATSSQPAHALAPDLVKRFRHDIWTQNEGLSGAPVNSIAQTTDGYLWLGTGDGLVRFGGANFSRFRKSNVPPIVDNEITALAADAAGGLWVATAAGGVITTRRAPP